MRERKKTTAVSEDTVRVEGKVSGSLEAATVARQAGRQGGSEDGRTLLSKLGRDIRGMPG